MSDSPVSAAQPYQTVGQTVNTHDEYVNPDWGTRRRYSRFVYVHSPGRVVPCASPIASVDSFFAFGLFAVAKQSRFFPPELVETFEPVMQEEARHILFFVNWVAWHRRNLPWWQRPWFCCLVAAVWVRLVRERIGLARGVGAEPEETPQDNNFTLTGSKAVADIDLSAAALLDICLAENERRMAGYDPRLLRPMFVSRLVRLVRRFLRDPKPQPETVSG